jgi:hypothetical protein
LPQAKNRKRKKFHFLIVGEGTERQWLERSHEPRIDGAG